MILLTAGFVRDIFDCCCLYQRNDNKGLPLSKGWATILIGYSVAAFEYYILNDHISHSASVARLFEVVIEMYTSSCIVIHVHSFAKR